MTMKPRWMLAAALAVAGFAAAAPATAQDEDDGGPNNVVKVVNTVDHTVLERARVKVGSTDADKVTSTNLALAVSRDCTGCQSLAAAFQAVLVTGSPTEVSPRNAGVAANGECTSCGAFAFAYQYVVSVDREVELSDAARQQVRQIDAEADAVLASGRPYDEMDLALKDLAKRFKAVVDEQIASAGADVEDRETSTRRRIRD